jgi:hypothetical protein
MLQVVAVSFSLFMIICGCAFWAIGSSSKLDPLNRLILASNALHIANLVLVVSFFRDVSSNPKDQILAHSLFDANIFAVQRHLPAFCGYKLAALAVSLADRYLVYNSRISPRNPQQSTITILIDAANIIYILYSKQFQVVAAILIYNSCNEAADAVLRLANFYQIRQTFINLAHAAEVLTSISLRFLAGPLILWKMAFTASLFLFNVSLPVTIMLISLAISNTMSFALSVFLCGVFLNSNARHIRFRIHDS